MFSDLFFPHKNRRHISQKGRFLHFITRRCYCQSQQSRLISRAVPLLTQWSGDFSPAFSSTATTKEGLPMPPARLGQQQQGAMYIPVDTKKHWSLRLYSMIQSICIWIDFYRYMYYQFWHTVNSLFHTSTRVLNSVILLFRIKLREY